MPPRPSLHPPSFSFLWWLQVTSLSQVYLGYMRVKKKTLGTCYFVIPQDLWSLDSQLSSFQPFRGLLWLPVELFPGGAGKSEFVLFCLGTRRQLDF